MSTSIIIVGALLLWILAFLYLRSYTKRRTDPERILAEYSDEVDRMVAAIDAAADRDTRLVEERVKVLRGILEETDRRLAALSRELERRSLEDNTRRELARTRSQKAAPSTGSPRPSAVPSPDKKALARSSSPAPDLFSGAESANPAPAPVAAATAPAVEGEPQPAAPAPVAAASVAAASAPDVESAKDPAIQTVSLPRIRRSEQQIEPAPLSFAEQVAKLYRQGMSVELIARTLEAAEAEVELAVALVDNNWSAGET